MEPAMICLTTSAAIVDSSMECAMAGVGRDDGEYQARPLGKGECPLP
jgi:hypothetical protein